MPMRYDENNNFFDDLNDVDDLEVNDEPWMIDNEEDEVPSYGKNYFPQTSED